MIRRMFILFVVFYSLFPFITSKVGCPSDENIFPCKCTINPAPRLICKKIFSPKTLLNVFKNLEGYTFQEVHIISTAMMSIPGEIFLKTYSKELYISNCIFGKIFDESIKWTNIRNGNRQPVKIQIENVKVTRGVPFANFSSFINLKELVINSSPMGYLPREFSSSLPKDMKQLSLSKNGIREIMPGALKLLSSLETVLIEHNKLQNITRDIFPTPFKVRIVSFDYNRIESIPCEMFYDMPNLQVLSMRNNLITTIPENAFYGNALSISYLRFEGNPLKCSCEIQWIVKYKHDNISGNCTAPEELSGKLLKDLNPSDFLC